MRRWKTLLTTTALAGGALALVPGSPASAGVVAAASGSTITVTVTGDATVGFTCVGNVVRVNNTATSPTVSCSSFSHATVNGDSGMQTIYGTDLDRAEFTADPYLTATLGDGVDSVTTTMQSDSINLGNGDDYLTVFAGGPADSSLQAGADSDFIEFYGTTGNDTFTATSGSTNLALAWNNGGSPVTYQVQNGEILRISGDDGNDTFSDTAITLASSIDRFDAYGEKGNDTFNSGAIQTNLGGGPGNNVFNGGTLEDIIDSNSETDVLNHIDDNDYVYDRNNPVYGGRTYHVDGGLQAYSTSFDTTDAQVRMRDSSTAGTNWLVTGSLSRAGQQALPDSFKYLNVGLTGYPDLDDHGLLDVVLQPGNDLITAYGDGADNDLADITVPNGVWNTSGNAASGTQIINAVGATYTEVQLSNFGPVSIHGPWTNKNRGWTHRVYRDLLFRFADTTTLDEGQALLGNGTVTRPQVTADLMNTDEYRGLDVDRVFVQFLRRKADPSGRASWITSLRNGKPLWKFRAQLLGSGEYYTYAGQTNAEWVNLAYEDVLGRAPDPSGKAYWTNKLNYGANRGSVALQFINSAEEKRSLVNEQFLRFLDRKATTGELNTWVPTLTNAGGEQNLIAFLANSSTYYNRD